MKEEERHTKILQATVAPFEGLEGEIMAIAPISISAPFRPIPSYPVPSASAHGRRVQGTSLPPVKTGGYVRETPDGVIPNPFQQRVTKSLSEAEGQIPASEQGLHSLPSALADGWRRV